MTTFTEDGEVILKNYLSSLVELYVTKNLDDYPFEAVVLGFPVYEYAVTFQSQEELYGRIKSIAHVLGVETFEGTGKDLKIQMEIV